MKARLLLLFVGIMFGFTTQAQPTPDVSISGTYDSEVEVIYPQELRPLSAKKLGDFKIKKAHYLACDIDFLVSMALYEAKEKGGNAVYLTSVKPPAKGRNCYSIEGEIYKLSEPYKSVPNPFYDHEILISTEEGNTTKYILPLFPGGLEDMTAFVYRKFNYPNSALRDKLAGKVEVSFKVDEKGKITEAQIDKGIRWDLDQEVLRVISTMPEWVPGYQNGEAVEVIYTLPIRLYPWLTH